MKLELNIPDSTYYQQEEMWENLRGFFQAALNRAIVGHYRYGYPSKTKLYMDRLEKEFDTYVRMGNFEQLLNTVVYAWLESESPQNKKFYFDPTVESVTRHDN